MNSSSSSSLVKQLDKKKSQFIYTDEMLISRFQSGDENAYVELVNRYKDRLNNNLLDAKDIALHSAIFDKSGKVKNTTAGLAYKEFDSLRKYYWNEILEVAKDKYRAGEITKADVFVCVCLDVCVCVYMCICVYVCMCVCVSVCLCVCV